MDKTNSFDDNLKDNLHLSSYYMKPSRNIFEEAWIKKDEEIKDPLFFNIRLKVKVVATSVCLMAFCFSILLMVSSNSRTFAMNSIKSIFVVEKTNINYIVAEKPKNEPLEYENIGGVLVDESNRNLVEKRLGFSFYIPEKIGQNFTRTYLPTIGMTAYKIKVEDIPAFADKFKNALGDDNAFRELTNNNIKLYVTGIYSDSMNNTYYLNISKDKKESNKTIISEEIIQSIKCTIWETKLGMYPTKQDGNSISDDYSKKPTYLKQFRYLDWNYNGINYKVTSPEETLAPDKLTNFASEYIKDLKTH